MRVKIGGNSVKIRSTSKGVVVGNGDLGSMSSRGTSKTGRCRVKKANAAKRRERCLKAGQAIPAVKKQVINTKKKKASGGFEKQRKDVRRARLSGSYK